MVESFKKLHMYPILFTRYFPPNGRTTTEHFYSHDKKVYQKSKTILAAGFVFKCEILITGEISLTIADKAKEEDIAIEVCQNNKSVLLAVDKLIMDFDLEGR